jgi:hypothetical protein
MSQNFIRNWIGCVALALPMFLLSAHPILASEGTTVNSAGEKNAEPENISRAIISKPDKLKPADNKFVQPQSVNTAYVYFNLNNGTSIIFTELSIRPSGSSTWPYFQLLGGSIVPNESQLITLVDYNTCYYDILLKNRSGRIEYHNFGVNFCDVRNYNLRE